MLITLMVMGYCSLDKQDLEHVSISKGCISMLCIDVKEQGFLSNLHQLVP